MPVQLPIAFPSEAEALRQYCLAQAGWTPTQRLLAVVDTLAAAEALSEAGGRREEQLKYQQGLEDEWRRRMMEFIKQHVRT
jgi:hypothetical protein